jgi:hypothetical protein
MYHHLPDPRNQHFLRFGPCERGCYFTIDEFGYWEVGNPADAKTDRALTRLGSPPCGCWAASLLWQGFRVARPQLSRRKLLLPILRVRRRLPRLEVPVVSWPFNSGMLFNPVADALDDRGKMIGHYRVDTQNGCLFFTCRGRPPLLAQFRRVSQDRPPGGGFKVDWRAYGGNIVVAKALNQAFHGVGGLLTALDAVALDYAMGGLEAYLIEE